VCAAGLEAATPLEGRVAAGPGKASLIDIIDVTRFDETGQIASMRAFWSADTIRVVDA
jgi:hypothetical protein